MKDSSQIKYQAITCDSGMMDVLYEGSDLKSASDAALAHDGAATIYHFGYDGLSRLVATYSKGQCLRGYVYTRGAVYFLAGRSA